MNTKGIFKVSTLIAAMAALPSFAAQSGVTIPVAEQKQMEQVIHNYLVSHPEVLVEASQVLQKKQQEEAQLQAKSSIASNASTLFSGKLAVSGNPKGDVTLVEFFDYQCIHCKKMKPVVAGLLEKNKNLRVIYKEFPIFGKSSEMASKAALAAAMQGKYKAMQDALLNQTKQLDEEAVMNAAKSVGLNLDQLKKDMASQQVQDELAQNRKLAEEIHLMGTPAFIIASTPNGQFNAKIQPNFVPGGASQEALQEMINKEVSKG